jgi:uncharacterized protein (TIGR02646 family)
MIRIDRPAVVPAGLAPGVALANAKAALHDADIVLYSTRRGRFAFDDTVYGCPTVRESLKAAQHHKCCFCESRVEHIAYGEIEHFRPKAEWRQSRGSRISRPGYYWLAYDWDNLLWSCKTCNGRHKGCIFPLAEPANRDCPGRSLAGEAPLLVDPTRTDPRLHIRFKLNVAEGLTDLGETTIDVLGLNREQLLEQRQEKVNEIMLAWEAVEDAAQAGTPPRARAVATLERAVQPTSAYSSMAIDLVADLTRLASS